jgi:perosamine synthetase
MQLFNTHITEQAVQNVEKVLRSGFLNQGKMVDELERQIARRGIINPLTVNSCTSALHLALILSNAKGREVILPSQTFIATGLAVLMAGGIPVFADILSDGNIDPESMQKLITDKTAAIICVHWAGNPCNMKYINDICKQYTHIKVIEDAAHAFGATYLTQPMGAFADFCCFSFQSIKMLTCGDGGLLTCANHDDYLQARKLRWFGIDKTTMEHDSSGCRIFDVTELGFKYHMNDLNAALTLGNLVNIDDRLDTRRSNYMTLGIPISKVDGIKVVPHKVGSSHWLFNCLVERRDEFIKVMQGRGIPASVVDKSIHHNSIFKTCRTDNLTNQTYFDAHQVNLPIHEDLKPEELQQIIKAVQDGW